MKNKLFGKANSLAEYFFKKYFKNPLTNQKVSAIITKVKRNAAMAQLAEHVLGKDEVTSSNLVSSSIKYTAIKVVYFCFIREVNQLFFIN